MCFCISLSFMPAWSRDNCNYQIITFDRTDDIHLVTFVNLPSSGEFQGLSIAAPEWAPFSRHPGHATPATSQNHMFVLETSTCTNVVISTKFHEINGMLWTTLRSSPVSMPGHTHHTPDPIQIPSEQVTKPPPQLLMPSRVPPTHPDHWPALFRKFPRHYTCSRTKYIYFTWRTHIQRKSPCLIKSWDQRDYIFIFSEDNNADAYQQTASQLLTNNDNDCKQVTTAILFTSSLWSLMSYSMDDCSPSKQHLAPFLTLSVTFR